MTRRSARAPPARRRGRRRRPGRPGDRLLPRAAGPRLHDPRSRRRRRRRPGASAGTRCGCSRPARYDSLPGLPVPGRPRQLPGPRRRRRLPHRLRARLRAAGRARTAACAPCAPAERRLPWSSSTTARYARRAGRDRHRARSRSRACRRSPSAWTPSVVQFHSTAYRRPQQIPDGPGARRRRRQHRLPDRRGARRARTRCTCRSARARRRCRSGSSAATCSATSKRSRLMRTPRDLAARAAAAGPRDADRLEPARGAPPGHPPARAHRRTSPAAR